MIDDLTLKTFAYVYGKASLMSFCIYSIFAVFGEQVFTRFFSINFQSFKLFGGIIIFSYAFLFIMKGTKGMLQIKENLDDLASEIAIPFIVGAGTISLSILIGHQSSSSFIALGAIGGVLIVNFILVIIFAGIKSFFHKKRNIAFEKYISIAMRLNGLFMGAIGVHMVIESIRGLFTV